MSLRAGQLDLARDARLVGRQLYYEQLSFWRNRYGAFFTVVFSVLLLVMVAGASGNHHKTFYGSSEIQYYVPAFAAYGVMSASFNNLAIALVTRRESGILKRLRLSPLPTPVYLGAVLLNVLAVSAVDVAVLLAIGRLSFGVHLPATPLAFIVMFLIGSLSFTALGVAMSTVVPNQEAAGPIVSIVFFVLLFVSGLWFPIASSSTLGRIGSFFPFRHFILAMFAPFNGVPHASPWAWHDILVVAAWGVGATLFALRRFAWEPRRR